MISDQIAPNIDLIFKAPGNYDGFTLLQGALGYAIQIYCDFSGYSTWRSEARAMGFRFMENFQMPYSSVTITEFWQRWHISLSTWLRDYLYIRWEETGKDRANVCQPDVTMLLGGLWHGASWNFVLWGGLHGTALAIHKGWMAVDPLARFKGDRIFDLSSSLFSRLLTFGLVMLGWIFFGRNPGVLRPGP